MNKNFCDTLGHTLNKSKTKSAHKFGNSDRFPKTKHSECLQSSYDLNSSSEFKNGKHKLNGKFGREEKFSQTYREIQRKSLSPAPNTYHEINSSRLRENNINKTTFGTQKKLVLKTTPNPGPGSYTNSYNPELQLSYTMRTKTKSNITSWNQTGPGQYNPSQALLSGTPNSNIIVSKSARFNNKNNHYPAPGAYKVEKSMHDPVITSKYNESSKYSFGKTSKHQRIYTETPGPGSYIEFSEFHDNELSPRR